MGEKETAFGACQEIPRHAAQHPFAQAIVAVGARDDQIEAVDKVAKTRANLTRNLP